MQLHLTITEILAIGTFLILLFGSMQGVFLAIMRARFAAKTCIYTRDGSQIYKTVVSCDKFVEKRDMERKAMREALEKDIKEKVNQIKDDNERFVKSLQELFSAQNKRLSDTISETIKEAIQPQA